jgi:hypothetical protein
MAQQYRDAVEALEDPELRATFEEERRNFMREITADFAAFGTAVSKDGKHVPLRDVLLPVEVDDS